MHMKLRLGMAMVVTVLLLGCGSKTSVSERNFARAIEQSLKQQDRLCLDIDKWPVDISERDLVTVKAIPSGQAAQVAALEAVGLARGEEVEVPNVRYDGKPTGSSYKVKRYTLTDAAKPFEKTREVSSYSVDGAVKVSLTELCWGRKGLGKVVKWEGPMKFGDYQEARVIYHYKLVEVPDWAKQPIIKAAFPWVGTMIEGAGKVEQVETVKLTSAGWEAGGMGF